MDEFEKASKISNEILALIVARDELGLKEYLDRVNTQRYDSTWCSCVALLMNLRLSYPDDFDWFGWFLSGYPDYQRIVNDYFLYLLSRSALYVVDPALFVV